MFGGKFGAFGTEGCHCFDPDHPTYRRISAIARLRNRQDSIGKALRRGHHYLRETAFESYPFAVHGPGELTAWSQVLFTTEVVVAFNPHGMEPRGAYVTIDRGFHPIGSKLQVLYRGDWDDGQLSNPPQNEYIEVEGKENRVVVRIDLPACGMMILA